MKKKILISRNGSLDLSKFLPTHMSYEAGRSYEDSSSVERTERQAAAPVYQDARKVLNDTRDATTVVLQSPEEVRKEKQSPATYIQLLDDLEEKLILSSPDNTDKVRSAIEIQKQVVSGLMGVVLPHVEQSIRSNMRKLEKQYGEKDNRPKKKKKQKQYVEM